MKHDMSAKYIAKSSAIASRLLGGEMMIMSAVDSTFFTLNPVATVDLAGRGRRYPVVGDRGRSRLRRVRG